MPSTRSTSRLRSRITRSSLLQDTSAKWARRDDSGSRWVRLSRLLEDQLHNKLKHPRVQCPRDRAEGSRAEAGIGSRKRRGVGDVKGLSAQFHAKAFIDRERLAQHHVESPVS